MKKYLPVLIVILILLAVLYYFFKSEKISLVEPSQGLVDSISLVVMNEFGDKDQPNISQPAAKDLQWKAWEAWFKNCPQNETFKKDIVYLGPSSSKGLGYIMSKNKTINGLDFIKISPDTFLFNTFFDKGVDVPQCDFSQMKDFTFELVASGNFLKSVNAELGTFVAKAKKITVKTGSWRIESINPDFMEYVNRSDQPSLKTYREALLDNGNIVLTKVLKVSGFEAEIESEDSIDVGLKAKLENGYNVNVVPSDSSRRIGFDLNFKRTSKNIVTVSSTGEFSLFGQASKGKKSK